MLKNYFIIAWRNITRHKAYTIINVAGLALGICACIVIFLVSRYELSFDTFHPGKEFIYRVGSKIKEMVRSDGDIPPPAPEAIRKEITGIETVASYYPYYQPVVTIPHADKTTGRFSGNENNVIIADREYFSVFTYDWLAGSPAVSMNDPFKVVLSANEGRKYFGQIPFPSMLGKEVIYNDSLRLTVSGIVKDWTGNTDFAYTDFISFPTIQNSFLKNARHVDDWRLIKGVGEYYWPVSFVKLSGSAKVSRINAELNALIKAHMGAETSAGFGLQLQPLSDIHFNNNYSDENIRKAHLPTLYALMAIALFILVIAAINFINLSTAQSMQRAKEIGVRKVLGSSRGNLVFQFLAETFVLCSIAGVVAALIVRPALFLFKDFIPGGVSFNLSNPYTLLFLLLVIVGTSLLAGFYPAKIASAYLPVLSLKGAGIQKGSEKWWLRKGLIVFQFTISLVFIIGTIVIGNQIRYMLHTDFGFKTDAIVSLDNWSWKDDIGKTKVLSEKIRQLPGVDRVIIQSGAPMGWGMTTSGVTYKGKAEVKQDVSLDCGNEDFIPFYQMRLLSGRNIMHSDSLTEFVINETCSRALGFSKPEAALGKFLYWNGKTIPVVGVVSDFHQSSFRDVIRPLVIGHQPGMERNVAIRLSSKGKDAENIKGLLTKVEKIWKEVFPGKEFNYSFMDESIASFYERERKTSKLMQAAMSITIFISCMGLFGLIMFTAEKKAKEIGIRKVLGASVADITVLLTREFVLLVVIALLIASPLAWIFMTKWLQDFAYRVSISGWVFVSAGLTAILIALGTVGFQAIKSAIANPVKSLRTE